MTMHQAVSNGSYDVDRVRADFPALAMKVYGKPLVYLDNAASAQKPTAVLERMTQAYTSEYANLHRQRREILPHPRHIIGTVLDGRMLGHALASSQRCAAVIASSRRSSLTMDSIASPTNA